MSYTRSDYNQKTTKSAHQTTLRAILVGLAIIAVYALLSNIKPTPTPSCWQPTYDGHYGMTNECR